MTLEKGLDERGRLILHAEKFLQAPLNPSRLSICPTLDLIAVVTSDGHLDIFRLNGQNAAIVKRANSDATISSFKWAPSGGFLRCEWSDGKVQENATSDGKVLSEVSFRTIDSVKWPSEFAHYAFGDMIVDRDNSPRVSTQIKQNSSQTLDLQHKISIDDWPLDVESAGNIRDRERLLNPTCDLPHDLGSINMRTELPLLNALPYVKDQNIPLTISSELFTSQSTLNMLLRPEPYLSPDPKNCLALIRLACLDNKQIQIRITSQDIPFGIVELSPSPESPEQRVVAHANNMFSTCFALLTTRKIPSSTRAVTTNVGLSVISLHGLWKSYEFLDSVFKASASLNALTEYIVQTILCIRSVWTSSQDLPSRFMGNIIESLSSAAELDLVSALYQLAVTGYCIAPLKEWLVDELGDRGYKRWDTAVTHGYIRIIELVHEHLLPALDHASIAASTFRSLCSVQGQSSPLKLDRQGPTDTLMHLDLLRLLGHNILRYAAEELHQFRVFSTWISHQIPLLGADPGSATAKDAAIAAAVVDHALLLAYVVGPLTKSRLHLFLGLQSPSIQTCPRSVAPTATDIKILLDEHRRKPLQPSRSPFFGVDQVNLLYQGLWLQDDLPKDHVALLQTVLHDTLIIDTQALEAGSLTCQDMRMVFEGLGSSDDMTTFIAMVLQGQTNRVHIHRVTHEAMLHMPTAASQTGIRSKQVVRLDFGPGEIKGVQFGDDDVFLVLLVTKDLTSVLHLPYSSRATHLDKRRLFPNGSSPMLKNDWRQGTCRREDNTTFDFSKPESREPHTLIDFSHPDGIGEFVPEHLYVRYYKDKRVIVLLDRDRTRYRVYLVPKIEPQPGAAEKLEDLGLDDWAAFAA